MSEIILSNRVLNMAESATLAMTNKSRELKAQGIDVISLSIGEHARIGQASWCRRHQQ